MNEYLSELMTLVIILPHQLKHHIFIVLEVSYRISFMRSSSNVVKVFPSILSLAKVIVLILIPVMILLAKLH